MQEVTWAAFPPISQLRNVRIHFCNYAESYFERGHLMAPLSEALVSRAFTSYQPIYHFTFCLQSLQPFFTAMCFLTWDPAPSLLTHNFQGKKTDSIAYAIGSSCTSKSSSIIANLSPIIPATQADPYFFKIHCNAAIPSVPGHSYRSPYLR